MTHVLAAVAWPYANGPRHLGHVAGFGAQGDGYVRFALIETEQRIAQAARQLKRGLTKLG